MSDLHHVRVYLREAVLLLLGLDKTPSGGLTEGKHIASAEGGGSGTTSDAREKGVITTESAAGLVSQWPVIWTGIGAEVSKESGHEASPSGSTAMCANEHSRTDERV
jgi:hypothetical protein